MDKNPLKLQVGTSYWVRYILTPEPGEWKLVKITHFTNDGTPWMEGGVGSYTSGILNADGYEVREALGKPINPKTYSKEQIQPLLDSLDQVLAAFHGRSLAKFTTEEIEAIWKAKEVRALF